MVTVLRNTLMFFVSALVLGSCTREITPEERRADRLFAAGTEAYQRGGLLQARVLLDSALEQNTTLGRTRQMAEICRLTGHILVRFAEFDSARAFYEQSAEHYRSIADRTAQRAVTLDIANLHAVMGEEHAAHEIYVESLRLAQLFEEAAGTEEIRWDLLPSCRKVEDFETARQVLADLNAQYATSGDPVKQARLMMETGAMQSQQQDFVSAIESFRRAQVLADQGRDSVLAIGAILQLARAIGATGNSFESFTAYSDGLKRCDITRGARALREEMLIRVGNIYLRNSQPGEAVRFYRAALTSAIRMHNRLAEGYMFVQIGHCEIAVQGNQAAALRSYESALDLFRGVGYPEGISYTMLSIGLAQVRSGQLLEGAESMRTAIAYSERCMLERDADDMFGDCEEAYVGHQPDAVYDALVDLLLQTGKNDEAFALADRARGRQVFARLSALETETRNPALTGALDGFRHVKALEAGAERILARTLEEGTASSYVIDRIDRVMDRLAGELATTASRVTDAEKSFTPATTIPATRVSDVQRALPRGAALVLPVPTRRSLYTFCLTSSGLSTRVAAVDRHTIESTCREYLALLRSRQAYADSSAGIQRAVDNRIGELTTFLYGACIRPVESDLAGSTKVIIVSDPGMGPIPYHALRRGTGRSGGPYAIEQFPITYLPAASMLPFVPAGTRAPETVIAVGHAGSTAWDVEYELRDIRAFFKDAQLFFVKEATLATLQKEHADLLHLAAPFHASDRSPANSYVILSDGMAFNTSTHVPWGKLFSISSFATIVVSDLGDRGGTIRPDFSSIFLINGTQNLIVQCYPATRKTKKFFGEIFYTTLLAGAGTQQALRQTQMEMIRNPEYASPHLWAPFFTWGK